MKRLDNLCRSERYFTSALLTGLLFHDNLNGTLKFLNWIIQNKNIRMVNLRNQKSERLNPIINIHHVEVITELNIKRDLNYYFPDELNQIKNDLVKSNQGIQISQFQNVPDVIIIADKYLFIIECKYFVKAQSREKINQQLLAQKEEIQVIVKYLNPLIEQYCHIFLGPQTNLKVNEYECEVILSWKDIYNFSTELLGSKSYITERLKDSMLRFLAREVKSNRVTNMSLGRKIKMNYSHKVSLNQLINLCRQEGDKIVVGFHGGIIKLLNSPKMYLEHRIYKVDSAVDGAGKKESRNWIQGSKFLNVIKDIIDD